MRKTDYCVLVKSFLKRKCIQTFKSKLFLIVEYQFHFQGFKVIAPESIQVLKPLFLAVYELSLQKIMFTRTSFRRFTKLST